MSFIIAQERYFSMTSRVWTAEEYISFSRLFFLKLRREPLKIKTDESITIVKITMEIKISSKVIPSGITLFPSENF